MISVKDKYYMSFSLGVKEDLPEYKDFIEIGDLELFKIVEEAGGYLPIFEMRFTTFDTKVIQAVNEGNILVVSMGVTPENAFSSRFRITNATTYQAGDNKRMIHMLGMYDAREYQNNQKVSISEEKSGIEVIREIASRYFKVKGNVTESQDSQRWIQPTVSDMRHISEIWKHSSLANSFPLIGVGALGTFIIKDYKKLVTEDPKWKLQIGQGDNVIPYDADYSLVSNSGLLNQLYGYGKSKVVNDSETGENSIVEPESKSRITNTGMNRGATLTRRIGSQGVQNENTHSTYWDTYDLNMMSFANFSSLELVVPFSNLYSPIELLDLVTFKEASGSSEPSIGSTSGAYVVSGITRTFSEESLVTILTLSREAFDDMTGDTR